jgi:hypothetical protein
MKDHRPNQEEGRAGIDYDRIGGNIFVWPPGLYFYVLCTRKEWLEGIYEH